MAYTWPSGPEQTLISPDGSPGLDLPSNPCYHSGPPGRPAFLSPAPGAWRGDFCSKTSVLAGPWTTLQGPRSEVPPGTMPCPHPTSTVPFAVSACHTSPAPNLGVPARSMRPRTSCNRSVSHAVGGLTRLGGGRHAVFDLLPVHSRVPCDPLRRYEVSIWMQRNGSCAGPAK
jgi:hypothetical protein